jgi:hypothetical protein
MTLCIGLYEFVSNETRGRGAEAQSGRVETADRENSTINGRRFLVHSVVLSSAVSFLAKRSWSTAPTDPNGAPAPRNSHTLHI